MTSLFRSTAQCLRSGLAVYRARPAGGRSRAASARFLCSAELQKDLGEMVKKDKVVVFIKGTPAQPMCGFSNAVVQILRMHGVDEYAAYNVLEDQDLRQGRHRDPAAPAGQQQVEIRAPAKLCTVDDEEGVCSGDEED